MITRTLYPVPAATEGNFTLPEMDLTKFALVDTSVDAKTGAMEGFYKYVGTGADPDAPMTLRLGIYPSKSSTNVSCKLSTWETVENGTTELLEKAVFTFASSVASPNGLPTIGLSTSGEDDYEKCMTVVVQAIRYSVANLANGIPAIITTAPVP